MADEFYVECFLEGRDGLTKLAELACDRDGPSEEALAANLAKMYRVEDSNRIKLILRQATPSDVAAVTDLLQAANNRSLQAAWADAAVRLASGTQKTQFNSEDCAPAEWVEAIESARIGNARWKDASWGNNAAPSWELFDGNQVLAAAFYYSAENTERYANKFDRKAYVQVTLFDRDENITRGFETLQPNLIAILSVASQFQEPPLTALTLAANRTFAEKKAFWIEIP